MNFSLVNNFWLNSRGLTYADSGSVTWSFNKNTNTISANITGAAVGANPTAKVGPAVVNGVAGTWMRSDAAPPVDLTANYTWTGSHIFQKPVVIASSTTGNIFQAGDGTRTLYINTGGSVVQLGTLTNHALQFFVNNGGAALSIATSGAITVSGTFAINGGTPTAALAGFGSPSGTPTSGLTNAATLAQTAGTLAALLAYLKTIGVIAA